MATLPTPVRVALGLAATAIDEARKLPETLPQLPATALGTAMQASLRVQQHIAQYAARGDELLTALRGTSEDAPAWATFDDDSAANTNGNGAGKAAFDLIDEADAAVAADVVPLDPAAPDYPGVPAEADDAPPTATPKASGRKAPTKTPATKTSATKTPTTKTPATKAAGKAAAKATAKKATAKKDPARVKGSEPLKVAAQRAEAGADPNPSVLAAEIVSARQVETDDR